MRWQTNGCQGTCPVLDTGNPLKLLRHPDCDKFCKCNWGSSIIMECPKGLLFNFDEGSCDWPENVVCLSESLDYLSASWEYDDYEDNYHEEDVSWIPPYSELIQLFF